MIRSTRSQSTGSAGAGRFHDCIPESDNAGWHTGSVAIGHCADSPWLRLGTCFEDSAADFRETPTELLVHRPVPAGTSRMKACQHCWHAPAPSMPARKHYTVRRHHFPLDVPEQCCGVCLSTLTSRGSTDGYSRTTPAIRCPARPTSAPSCSGCTPPARVLADDGREMPEIVDDMRTALDGGASACAMLAIESPAPFRWDSKTTGGNAGNAGNLQSLGNSGLLGPAAKRRKLAEIGGNPLQILWSGIRPPFCCLTQGVHSNSQCRHRLRKLRKRLVPAGNDTAPARLL
jgi:hypothetical protein